MRDMRRESHARRGEDVQEQAELPEPQEIFDEYGADALRWYFFSNQPPWNSILFSERTIRDSIPEFLLRLWNVYSFFVIYANIDGFDPAAAIAGDAGSSTQESFQERRAAGPAPGAANWTAGSSAS